jgi:putative transposase
MKRSTFSEEQIVYAIRQAAAGTPVGDLCRQLGVSDATFYRLEAEVRPPGGE